MSTQERVVKEVQAPAPQSPTPEQFFDASDPTKPDIAFLKNHFYREGRLSEEQALYIIEKATEILRSEPNLLAVDGPPISRREPRYIAQLRLKPAELLRRIYFGYEARDPYAFYHAVSGEASAAVITKLQKALLRYGVPLVRPPEEDPGNSQSPLVIADVPQDRVERICAAAIDGMKRLHQDCEQLVSNIDLNQFVLVGDLSQEAESLKNSCKKLQFLLRTRRSSSASQDRIENLLETIKTSPVIKDIDLLPILNDFTELYCQFCELILAGEDTKATIGVLRQLVKEELKKAKERLEQFGTVRKHYEDSGRRDLSALLEENLKAAKESGFREGVSSEEEAQQVYVQLETVDNCFKKISEKLAEGKKFWENVDERLKLASSTPVKDQAKDPPDGFTTGPLELRIGNRARDIHTGLQNIHQTAEKYSGSRSMQKAGDHLVQKASKLTADCLQISGTHSSVENRFQNRSYDSKTARKEVASLTTGLARIIRGYEKVSQRWTKYLRSIYLLFWFAGTTAAQKRQVERYERYAEDVLYKEGLCSYMLPFESAMVGIGNRLHEMQKFWAGIRLVRDFRFGDTLRNI